MIVSFHSPLSPQMPTLCSSPPRGAALPLNSYLLTAVVVPLLLVVVKPLEVVVVVGDSIVAAFGCGLGRVANLRARMR